MQFVNKGHSTKVRLVESYGFKWITVKTDQVIDLPESVGLAYGFSKLEETSGKIQETKVETKQFESKKKELQSKLEKTKGIGKKTIQDVLSYFDSEEELKNALNSRKHLPFRDDVVEILRKKYG